ncbi:MAG: hypothetical protein RML56_11595 [Burkholderiales bacterium]|nr:hypothetical protein [Burkholderiales bacterium]
MVRGACALRPGVPGLSDNIRVRSVVGRFLEHARVFFFANDGAEDVYLASADWMDRNFFRRIEIAFPVLDPALKARVLREGLEAYLEDSAQSWLMNAEGGYERAPRRGRARGVQEELLARLGTLDLAARAAPRGGRDGRHGERVGGAPYGARRAKVTVQFDRAARERAPGPRPSGA